MTITEYVLAGGLAVAVVWLVLLQSRLNRLIAARAALTRGLSGEKRLTLEDITADLSSKVGEAQKRIEQVYDEHNKLGAEVAALIGESRYSLQRVGVVRFNPFGDTGGDQSFVVALLDRLGNGVVISSLHGRAGTRFYAKSLKNGHSSHSLSDEEEEAVKSALGQTAGTGAGRAAGRAMLDEHDT